MIRIVLDPRERHDFVKVGDLSDNVRIKRGGPFMHLKAYDIDGTLLRTGSANFSTSGENAQDNDLIVIRDPAAAAKFDAHFERMWESSTRAGACPLKQQLRMHKTARALVLLNASANSIIGTAVPARSADMVSNSTKLPLGDPCPAKLMTTKSSSCAADSVPRIACETSV